MPVDPLRIAAMITLVFFAVSLYFTVQELGIVFVVPFWTLAAIGLLFVPTSALFLYVRAFAGETTLGYWSYIKAEIAGHLILSFYVLSTAIVIWSQISITEKIILGLFFGLAFLFYITVTLDIRELVRDLKIKTALEPLTLVRYLINTVSAFFIIYFIVLISLDGKTGLDSLMLTHPYFPLTLIGVFLIFYFAFLQRTHKGFDELMKRGTITNLSYLMAFSVFFSLFILYYRIGPNGPLTRFPLFGAVFFGYFAILVAEVYSTTTLRVKEYKEKNDILDLLNHVAGHFFRTDVLEEMWDKVVEKYKTLDPELERARFYPPERTFDLEMTTEKGRSTAAVAMLKEMDEAAKKGETQVVAFDDNVPAEIERLLGEKVLLLPEELTDNVNLEKYYSRLLESTINNITESITPFVSYEDYSAIIKRLIKVDLFFNNLAYQEGRITIKKGIELSKKEFITHLKTYIKALGETFPFNRLLLRDSVRTEVDERLNQYSFSKADILNIVPTGVKELDEVLYGGFIKGTSTLLLSEERKAKNDVLFRFVAEGLKEGEAGLYATSRVSSKNLLSLFKRVVGNLKRLEIIDLYLSTQTENVVRIPVSDENRQIISTSLIHLKQAIVSTVKKNPKEEHKRAVLDVYSDLSKYHSKSDIQELIIGQVEGFSRWNITSIITLAPDLSSEELERHFDNVLLLSDVATVHVKKLFGGSPKKESFIIWGTYSPIEEPDFSFFLDEP